MAIEAALALMVLLLALSLLTIVRLGPVTSVPQPPGADEPGTGPASSSLVGTSERAMIAHSHAGGTSSSRRGHYVGRHGGRGRAGAQSSSGPPWGPAESPSADRQ
jgi:hypothetical protein